jgi:hypothetical protein
LGFNFIKVFDIDDLGQGRGKVSLLLKNQARAAQNLGVRTSLSGAVALQDCSNLLVLQSSRKPLRKLCPDSHE